MWKDYTRTYQMKGVVASMIILSRLINFFSNFDISKFIFWILVWKMFKPKIQLIKILEMFMLDIIKKYLKIILPFESLVWSEFSIIFKIILMKIYFARNSSKNSFLKTETPFSWFRFISSVFCRDLDFVKIILKFRVNLFFSACKSSRCL